MRSNSILTETETGTYYTGPLEPAIKALRDEYGDSLTVEHRDGDVAYWIVSEHRGSTPESPNQWGSGPTEEEAWRWLIGTEFGPLDETYGDEGYEQRQRQMLGLATTRVCATCDTVVPYPGTHPNEWQCVNPECGVWFHVVNGQTDRCPQCGGAPTT